MSVTTYLRNIFRDAHIELKSSQVIQHINQVGLGCVYPPHVDRKEDRYENDYRPMKVR